MNHLILHQRLAGSLRDADEALDLGIDIGMELGTIKRAIVDAMGPGWVPDGKHENFLRRLASVPVARTRDIFLLNYDTLVEASLEHTKLPYVDGFAGAETAYFDPNLLALPVERERVFRVYKLHGSINWSRDDDGTVRRRVCGYSADDRRLMIYPSEQKYVQTQYGIYETMMDSFRDRLRHREWKNNRLLVLGYSFGDEHINTAIEDSVNAPGSNLTVVAFVGPQESDAGLDGLRAMVARCDSRLSIAYGRSHFIGPALQADEWGEVKEMDLWKFENLSDFLAGGNDEQS